MRRPHAPYLLRALFLGATLGDGPEAVGRHGHAGHEFILIGTVVLVLGTALAAWSAWLHRRACRAIDADRYEPARASVLALSILVTAGGLAVVALVLWRALAPATALR